MQGRAALQAKPHFNAGSERSSWAGGSRAVLALHGYKTRANLALKAEKALYTSTEHSGLGSGENNTKCSETQTTEENQSQTYLLLTNHLSLLGLCKDGLVLAKRSRLMSSRIVRNFLWLYCAEHFTQAHEICHLSVVSQRKNHRQFDWTATATLVMQISLEQVINWGKEG